MAIDSIITFRTAESIQDTGNGKQSVRVRRHFLLVFKNCK